MSRIRLRRKGFGRLVLALVLVAGVFGAASAVHPVVAGVLSWLLLGYLVVRAWPAVRLDLGRMPSLRLPRRERGAYL